MSLKSYSTINFLKKSMQTQNGRIPAESCSMGRLNDRPQHSAVGGGEERNTLVACRLVP